MSPRGTLAAAAFAAGLALSLLPLSAPADDTPDAPRFEVDPFWPKPLPNHWILGMAVGVAVDARDHVFVIHRPNREYFDEDNELAPAGEAATGACCTPAPDVLEFDPAGNLVNAWGGPGEGYAWPASNHGITVDPQGNVWIAGNGPTDSHVLAFTHEGRFLRQIGEPGMPVDSLSTAHFASPAEVGFAPDGSEAYVADGYRNRRVVVLDPATGRVKRFWGAYGHRPRDGDMGTYDPEAPPSDQFRNPVHCVQPSRDGRLYVCDRLNDRIQVFEPDGTYVDEMRLSPDTPPQGSVWDIAFSADPGQRFMYVADGKNMKIHIADRKALRRLTSFGDGGRYPGQFFGVHNLATDSQGNVYTTETFQGRRVQKFVYKGLAPVTTADRGTPWPAERK